MILKLLDGQLVEASKMLVDVLESLELERGLFRKWGGCGSDWSVYSLVKLVLLAKYLDAFSIVSVDSCRDLLEDNSVNLVNRMICSDYYYEVEGIENEIYFVRKQTDNDIKLDTRELNSLLCQLKENENKY